MSTLLGPLSAKTVHEPFLFLPLLHNSGRLLKERICSSRSKFLPLGVDISLELGVSFINPNALRKAKILAFLSVVGLKEDANRKSQKLFPFVKMAEKLKGV